ncbi:MAG: leucyl aminopeptidase [Gemmatimonadetes bacterium]|nr:leucyl aminopeptidase [Gemmatimonadota bacterium]NNM04580.1 leucyl aminopeptidase [Gemmatimonadota bacterium]
MGERDDPHGKAADALDLHQGARRLAEVNGRIQEGEAVVIVTDPEMEHYAALVEEAARSCGGVVTTCVIPVRRQDGEEPPEPVAKAMAQASVVFSPVSVSITHTRAMRAALESGARAILMTAYTDEILTSPALLETDFHAQAPVCHKVGDAFTGGSQVRLTSPKGTDLSFSIEGRTANVLTNVPEPGQLAPVPDIEVNVVPVTGSANGLLIADASVPYLGIGILRDPVVCTIENGFITRMEGGPEADRIRVYLSSFGDHNCFNVAELGVGLNPNARLTGEMLEDEGVLGTIHIGIGTSHTLGGEIVAPTHYDLLMWEPTIEVDGRVVQKDKEIFG